MPSSIFRFPLRCRRIVPIKVSCLVRSMIRYLTPAQILEPANWAPEALYLASEQALPDLSWSRYSCLRGQLGCRGT